jgi:hypothetical protein
MEPERSARSDRRIDRPPLLASCPVGGHVALRADGVSGQGATYCGQVSGTGSIATTWAEPLRRFCRSLDGPVRRSFCRRIPTGQAALWTEGVRHPCRDAGRYPDPRRTTAVGNGGATAEVSAAVSASRTVNR